MSNPGIPTVSKIFAMTGNPAIDGLILKGLTVVAAALAGIIYGWLRAHGFSDPNLSLMISGAILSVLCTVAVFVWGWFVSKINQARAVSAGINLTVSGSALAADGHTVVARNDGATPPLPVTQATAPEIVKNFAPPASAIAVK